MTELFKVSQSKVNAYRTCHRKYYYKYVEKLRKKRKARPLQFGTMVHNMIEAQLNGQSPDKALAEMAKLQRKMFIEEIEEYGDIVVDVGYIMREYFKFWAKDPLKALKRKGKSAEHEFEVEIVKGEILAKGKIDGFVLHRKDNLLLENKSHKDFPNEDGRWRNLQSSVYIRFMDMLGWYNLDGTLWNYIRSKSPTRPRLLKDGSFSQAQLDSLPSVVVDSIKEAGQNPKEYKAMIARQEDQLPSWFKRVRSPRNEPTIKEIFKDFVTTSREMAAQHGKIGTRAIGKHCGWCDFEEICRVSLTGGDTEYVIEKNYTTEDEEPLEREDPSV